MGSRRDGATDDERAAGRYFKKLSYLEDFRIHCLLLHDVHDSAVIDTHHHLPSV